MPHRSNDVPIWPTERLTPEEDSIDDPEDLDDEIDDLLPADLWFVNVAPRRQCRPRLKHPGGTRADSNKPAKDRLILTADTTACFSRVI